MTCSSCTPSSMFHSRHCPYNAVAVHNKHSTRPTPRTYCVQLCDSSGNTNALLFDSRCCRTWIPMLMMQQSSTRSSTHFSYQLCLHSANQSAGFWHGALNYDSVPHGNVTTNLQKDNMPSSRHHIYRQEPTAIGHLAQRPNIAGTRQLAAATSHLTCDTDKFSLL